MRTGEKVMKRYLLLSLSVFWFVVCAIVAAILWVLAFPHHLWQPVFEKAFNWLDAAMEMEIEI